MFKRALWAGVGFGVGTASSWWVKRKVRKTVSRQAERLAPSAVRRRIADSVTQRASSVRDEVAGAVSEGRATAKKYRDDLEPEQRPHLRAVPDS
jgi:hypothetical protein